MEPKTKVSAKADKQELLITREFDLPVELLFKAYVEPALVEQWMGTNVLKLESKKHGVYLFETRDPKGNIYKFSGVIHDYLPNRKITRTFEFENMPFGVQLEFLEFEPLTDQSSRLKIQTLFRSVASRDKLLQMPFAQGLNMAHNRLQEIAGKLIATS
jgi:uncharacterized protein YndB with AHSA1/START domain